VRASGCRINGIVRSPSADRVASSHHGPRSNAIPVVKYDHTVPDI
jgi:hypothetical protein